MNHTNFFIWKDLYRTYVRAETQLTMLKYIMVDEIQALNSMRECSIKSLTML
jgi:hypothetical protein